MLPSVRLTLARMTAASVSGHITITVKAGAGVRVKPAHPLTADFAWAPTPTGALLPAQEAALAEVRAQLCALYDYRITCALTLHVAAGVPLLPLELEYDDPAPTLRLVLARMAVPPVSGNVRLVVDGGRLAFLRATHDLLPGFGWLPDPAQRESAASLAARDLVRLTVNSLAAARLSYHLLLAVRDGAPRLPLNIEYVDSRSGPDPDRAA